MSALQLIKEKAHKDGIKKKEETISSVATEIRSMFEELKTKIEKDRQTFAKALSKSSKEDGVKLRDAPVVPNYRKIRGDSNSSKSKMSKSNSSSKTSCF